jgi:hypothetical protein
VLDPARLRVDLPELPLSYRDNPRLAVERIARELVVLDPVP